MHSRTIIIAAGAFALALGLATGHTTVADVMLVEQAIGGEPITMTFSPEGFVSATHATSTASRSLDTKITDQDDSSPVSENDVQVLTSSGDVSVSSDNGALTVLMDSSGNAELSVLRRDETSATSVNVSVNGEDLPADQLTDSDITIDTNNTGTLDGDRNENEVEINRDINIDVENDTDSDTDIDRDIEAGDNDIRGEEQEVGDIRHGAVNIDLRGLDD